MRRFIMTRDINGYNGFGLPFSDNLVQLTLAADEAQQITVPKSNLAGYPNVLAVFSFEPGSMVWVALNDTAEAPTGAAVNTTSEGLPAARLIEFNAATETNTLSFITNDTSAEVGVAFYAVQ
jgi:hypothetical protein